jgi:hypothetical protein
MTIDTADNGENFLFTPDPPLRQSMKTLVKMKEGFRPEILSFAVSIIVGLHRDRYLNIRQFWRKAFPTKPNSGAESRSVRAVKYPYYRQ